MVKVAVKWVLVFSRRITIEHENGIYRGVGSPCETLGLVSFIRTFVSRKTTLILQRGSPLGSSLKKRSA